MKCLVFLIHSGKPRLENYRLIEAYSEFELAYKIYLDNESVQQYIIETLSVLCTTNSNYCNELENYLLIFR